MLYRARIGWLAALVLFNLVSSGVIAAFEEVLEAVVALAFFIPLIIGGTLGVLGMLLRIFRGGFEVGAVGLLIDFSFAVLVLGHAIG